MHDDGEGHERAHTLGLLYAFLVDVGLFAVALAGHADELANRHAALRNGIR